MINWEKTNVWNIFGINQKLSEEGIWRKFKGGIEIKVARLGNGLYDKKTEEVFRPHKKELRNDEMSEDLKLDLTRQIMAETILLEWRGLKDESGKSIASTYENKLSALTAMKDLADKVSVISMDDDNYRREVIEESKKTSGNASSGNLSGPKQNPSYAN